MSGSSFEIDYFRSAYKSSRLSFLSDCSYVAKYLSQQIILNELSTIKSAVAKESEFEEENLEIKVNDYTKEIAVRYEIDEGQKNEMSVRLPPSYPLAEVEIIGRSRVGVNQERWNKWLLTCKIACKVVHLNDSA